MSLKNKVAIITGASGGIGQSIVHKFVEEGAKVLAVDINEAAVEKVAKQYKGAVSALAVDVTKYDQVAKMMDVAVERFGTLDIVHNNAGMMYPKMLLDHDPAKDWDLITAVNQNGVYYGILAGARKLIALGKPGVI